MYRKTLFETLSQASWLEWIWIWNRNHRWYYAVTSSFEKECCRFSELPPPPSTKRKEGCDPFTVQCWMFPVSSLNLHFSYFISRECCGNPSQDLDESGGTIWWFTSNRYWQCLGWMSSMWEVKCLHLVCLEPCAEMPMWLWPGTSYFRIVKLHLPRPAGTCRPCTGLDLPRICQLSGFQCLVSQLWETEPVQLWWVSDWALEWLAGETGPEGRVRPWGATEGSAATC